MATEDDSNNNSNNIKCICSDKKVVEVDAKTWELFNKMVPDEGFHRAREPVEMDFVRSTIFKKILTYCVRISDATFSSDEDVLMRWMYDEFLHNEGLMSLFRLVQIADFLSLTSLDALVLQYVEDKSEEEISHMVRNEELKSLLKIVKWARFFLKNPEKLSSAVLPLVKKPQEELIVNKDVCSLIKLIKVARAEKLQPLQDMVVQYVDSRSKKELVQMVSTELYCRRTSYLDKSEYLRRGTTDTDNIFHDYIFTQEEEEDDDTLNQIPIEEATNQIPIEDGSKKKEECKTKTNKLKLVPCISKKPRTTKLNLNMDLSEF